MKTNKKKLSLTKKILIALLSGCILGIAIFYLKDYFHQTLIKQILNTFQSGLYLVGQAFIRLMQMLVIPLVFCSIVCGAMSMGDTKKLGKIGLKSMAFYLTTTALAIVVALFIANMIDPGLGIDNLDTLMSSAQEINQTTTKTPSMMEQILNIIPANIFSSLSSGDMLPIIFFALFLGIIIAQMGDKAETVSHVFSQFNDIMMNMTMMVMKVAPIGVLCLVSHTFSNTGLATIFPIFKYMFTVILALVIQCFGVYLILLFIFTKLNPITFIKKFIPVMQFAFSTATSTATIPVSIKTLEEKIGVSKKVSSFTIPLGATINMDGTAIMQGVAVVFAAQLMGIDLSMADYATVIATATIASVGTAGVPGVGLTTLIMVFKSVNLPIAPIGIIMGIDRLLDMARTAVNVTGDAVCTTIVAKGSGNFNPEVYKQK